MKSTIKFLMTITAFVLALTVQSFAQSTADTAAVDTTSTSAIDESSAEARDSATDAGSATSQGVRSGVGTVEGPAANSVHDPVATAAANRNLTEANTGINWLPWLLGIAIVIGGGYFIGRAQSRKSNSSFRENAPPRSRAS